jgi:hypothetical protein
MTVEASEVDSLAATVVPEKPEAEEVAALQLDADVEELAAMEEDDQLQLLDHPPQPSSALCVVRSRSLSQPWKSSSTGSLPS